MCRQCWTKRMGTKMATDGSTAAYARIVAQAEAAVAAVKDPELRRVAFETILATLLQGSSAGSAASRSSREHRLSERQSTTAARRSTAKAKKGRKGPKGHVEDLIDDGFFGKQRTIAQVKAELANRGHHIALTSLSGPLQELTRAKRLRRQKVAANKKGAKTTYAYSNW